MNNLIKWGIILITGAIGAFRLYSGGDYGDWADLAAQFTFWALLAFVFLQGLEAGLKFKKKK
ncbi:MAG TPA: hypothetical protein PLK34_03060 [Candidatus Pacearchaeota archaeon]|nr:hypothetical protein [Candidatus Pacearchaeota archaeon]